MQGDRCLIVKKIGSVKKVYTRYYFPVGKFKKNFRLIMLTKEKISHWHNDDGQLGRSTEKIHPKTHSNYASLTDSRKCIKDCTDIYKGKLVGKPEA